MFVYTTTIEGSTKEGKLKIVSDKTGNTIGTILLNIPKDHFSITSLDKKYEIIVQPNFFLGKQYRLISPNKEILGTLRINMSGTLWVGFQESYLNFLGVKYFTRGLFLNPFEKVIDHVIPTEIFGNDMKGFLVKIEGNLQINSQVDLEEQQTKILPALWTIFVASSQNIRRVSNLRFNIIMLLVITLLIPFLLLISIVIDKLKK